MPDLTDRQAAFVREYLISGNVSDAYRKAGYKVTTQHSAESAGSRLLKHVDVAAAVAAGRAKIIARAEAKLNLRLDDILGTLAHQITADRNKLVQHRIGACRFCHGIDHRYQWRTHREFADAMEAYMLKGEAYHANHTPPDDEGGYGYKRTVDPHPDCPECEGLGISFTILADTTKLPPEALILFEGIKETRDGIQILMPDRSKALELLGKHLGLAEKARDDGINAVAQAIREISQRGSAMPIGPAARALPDPYDDDDDEDVEP